MRADAMKELVTPADPSRVLYVLTKVLVISAFVGACAAEQPQTASSSVVPTIPLHVLARTIADYRGRTVRTCGSELQAIPGTEGKVAYAILSARDPASRHNLQASVHIATCAGERPRLDPGGCVIGRIAREDGSLQEPDAVMVSSHAVVDNEWFLHPQCRRSQ
jgi:hypothetical protein